MSDSRLAERLLQPAAATLARPATAREAQRILDTLAPNAVAIAGGTALQLGWPDGQAPAVVLVDVSRLPEAQGLAWPAEAAPRVLRIGCATTLATLAADAPLRVALPLLAQALDAIGAPAVRTLATLGGNLGWRHGDTLAPLLALDASVELAPGDWMRLADWLALPRAPLAVAVQVPLDAGAGWFEKVGGREAFSPSRLTIAGLAGRLAAVAADLPGRRLRAAERWLAAGRMQGSAHTPAHERASIEGLLAALHEDFAGTSDRDWRARAAAHLVLARATQAGTVP